MGEDTHPEVWRFLSSKGFRGAATPTFASPFHHWNHLPDRDTLVSCKINGAKKVTKPRICRSF